MKTKTGVHIDAAAIAAFNQGRVPDASQSDAVNKQRHGLTDPQYRVLRVVERMTPGLPITSADVRHSIREGVI